MTDRQFSELRAYRETESSCIDMGYRPLESLIRKGWLREVVAGCWQITAKGTAAFDAVVNGTVALTPDRDAA
jgi:hypothetical protein